MSKIKSIVTGAYGAIGKAIAGGLARQGYEVYLVGRDDTSLAGTRDDIVRTTGNREIFTAKVDLSSGDEIRKFCESWNGPLHCLINNAATAPRHRTETHEGIEMQWAVNVLSYVRMMRLFSGFMKDVPDARIVNVASYWAGGLYLDDPEFRKRRYDNDSAYRQAKQANRMLSAAWSELLKPLNITVNSCHPGDVNSKLSNAFGFGGHESPAEGAATPLMLAISSEVQSMTGLYFEHLRQADCSFSRDREAVKMLYELCESYG